MRITLHGIRHLGLQLLRRLVQLSVVLLIIALPFLSLYAHYRAANALEDETEMVGFRGEVLMEIDRRIGETEGLQELLDDNKGTLWSMQLGGVDSTDPLAAAEAISAGRSVYGPLLLSILPLVLVTLILGKVFCSWICPANLLLEITDKLRGVLRFAELPPADVEFSRANKYVLLGMGLLIAAVVGLPMFALIYPPAALSRMAHAWVFAGSLTGFLVLMGIIVLTELVVSRRWWCRTMCPGGALYGLLGWPRLLRVRLDADRCTSCRKCEPACQPGLNPVTESYGIECDNCGECVRKCPDKALRFTIGLPAIKKPQSAPPLISPAELASGKTAGIATLLAALLLCPSTANAHHILGLPHYSYKENYPQVPVLEYPAETGPYKVLFVCYPGKPVPTQPANLVFDIKNGETGRRYDQPISVRILQTFTFGGNREIFPPTEIPALDVLHKLSATFPQDGEYVVELTMDVEGQEEVIGFLMIAGEPSATTSVLVAVFCGLGVFLVTVRAIEKKRDRRKEQADG